MVPDFKRNKMEKYFIGLDLGTNGGVVVLDNQGLVVDVWKNPDNVQEWILRFEKYKDSNCFCVTERVHSQPHHGGKANFTFGKNVGISLTILEVCKIPFQEVSPAVWMKGFMMKKEKGESGTSWKNRLKNKAQQLYPKEKVTLWNADAFLIATYCRRSF